MFIRMFVVMIAVLMGSVAFAATPADVAKVAAMVTDHSVPALLRQKEFVNGQYLGDTIVFFQDGLRYSIYNTGTLPNLPGFLTISVRKNGTAGESSMESFTDHAFDGTVDFGIDVLKKKIFESGGDGFSKPEGTKFRQLWQQKYDAAIAASLAYKRRTGK